MNFVTPSDIRKFFPKRASSSHKGENGRVLVVAGSVDYHGAAIFSSLGALRSGADLVYLYGPEINFNVTRRASPELIVKKYPEDFLTPKSASEILRFVEAQHIDVMLLGPGLGKRRETVSAVVQLVNQVEIPVVLDADAILSRQSGVGSRLVHRSSKSVGGESGVGRIVTPHAGEFERMTGGKLKPKDVKKSAAIVSLWAKKLGMTILLKGPIDIIADQKGKIALNKTGNPGMTKGGTGDILGGFVTGLIAQRVDPFHACCLGAYLIGKAGDELYRREGTLFTTSELLEQIPQTVKIIIKKS